LVRTGGENAIIDTTEKSTLEPRLLASLTKDALKVVAVIDSSELRTPIERVSDTAMVYSMSRPASKRRRRLVSE